MAPASPSSFPAPPGCSCRAISWGGSRGILFVGGILSRQIKSLPIRNLADVTLTERRGGSGTITFGQVSFRLDFFPAGSWPGGRRSMPPPFDFIEQAREVYDVIRSGSAQKDAARSS